VTGEPTAFTELAAVLPVRDISAAMEHYEKLGFSVRREGGHVDPDGNLIRFGSPLA